MADQNTQEATSLPSHAEFKLLVDQANGGDRNALEALRRLLDDNPQIWQRVGDLAVHAELALISLVAGADNLMAESLKRSLEDLRAQLGADSASPLERMAIGRVVACWLQLQHVDVLTDKATPGSHAAKFLLQRQAQADRAYHAAIKSLTSIRQLLPGTITRDSGQAEKVETAASASCNQADGLRVFPDESSKRRRPA